MGRRGPNGFTSYMTLLITGVLAACTSATGSGSPTELPSSELTVSESPSPLPSMPGPTDEEAVVALWESVHTMRIDQIYSDAEIDDRAFDGLVTGDVSETLVSLVRIGRGDIPIVSTGSEFWPDVVIAPNGTTATISDCVLIATRAAAEPDAEPTVRSTVWSGAASETAEGWVLDDISLGRDNCVPTELNHQLLDTYREWHRGANEWWDPPDPDHELLTELMVQPGLGDMRALLAEHRDMGIVVRDPHSLENAVVFGLGIGEARIADCFPAHPDSAAAFDAETGERRDDLTPEPTPGQIDRTVLDLERTADGMWKANGWRSETNSDCTPGESPYGLAP